ncbi:MAG: hypothetical protein IRZ32_03395 [Solirubrobacteraceae bacterium]|nr:hypothetical protein [Solirubrobacteraceae bacterium]
MEHDDDVRRAEGAMEREIGDLERHREHLDADIERAREELEELRRQGLVPPAERG